MKKNYSQSSRALDKVPVKCWADMMNIYNRIPFVTKRNPGLPKYIAANAIEGLFIMIAKEEFKIRKGPVARTTEIFKQVFGG